MERFIFSCDNHVGYERRSGHKIPLHDQKAWAALLAFAQDFKPHHWILGGDILDCGALAHWNEGKRRPTEGFRILADAEECKKEILEPIQALTPSRIYLLGNHEDWIEDFLDKEPALEGVLGLEKLLGLDSWDVIPQGGVHHLGKLYFCHGDTIRGSEHVAKNAVLFYERSIRFGHHHTLQTFTKTSAIDLRQPKTGMAVPCLCRKDPKYNESRPNRWAQGFLFGYVLPDGGFWDFPVVIVNGQCVVNGKVYKG